MTSIDTQRFRNIHLAATFLAIHVALALPQESPGQLTAQSIIGNAVTDIGPQYKEVTDAIIRFRNRDFDGAEQLLEIAKQKNPQLAPAPVMLAAMYLAANDAAGARSALEQAVDQSPSDPEAYIVLGDLAYRDGRLTASELLFGKAESLLAGYTRNEKRKRSMSIRTFAGLSAAAEQREHWSEAENLLTQWLKIDPENTNALARLGRTQYHLDKEREAYATFQQLYSEDDTKPRPEINMALLYEQSDRRANAKKLMTLAAERDAETLQTQLAVAQWALEVGEMEMLKEHAAAALAIDPQSLEGMLLAGVSARAEKDYALAEDYFQKVFIQQPSNFASLNNLVLSLIEQTDERKRKRAVEFAQVAARTYSDRNTAAGREAAVTLAWVLFKMGREVDAQRGMQSALQSGGVTAESAYYAARVFADRGIPAAAIQILKPVIESDLYFLHRDDAEQLLAELEGE